MPSWIELKCWPCCLSALDWSQDGFLAVASHDWVEIVFPQTESWDEEQERIQWRHFSLEIPVFSNAELPGKRPVRFGIYSAGEEISASYPVSLSWSLPGLAKHRRCALACLTSNLVLSIWASEGKCQEEASWARRFIVNDALEDFFLSANREGNGRTSPILEEDLRVKTRIRAFAWAPSMDNGFYSSTVGTRLLWPQHLIAVSIDYNTIVVLDIRSPTTTLGVEEEWCAQGLGSFSLASNTDDDEPVNNTFDDLLNHQQFLSQICWSPWVQEDDVFYSVLAYATNSSVRARPVSFSLGKIEFGPEIVYVKTQNIFTGPIKWSLRPGAKGDLTLVVFVDNKVVSLTISYANALILNHADYLPDHRYDAVSGLVFDVREDGTSILHISTLQSTTHNPTAALELCPSHISEAPNPSWHEEIINSQLLFSLKNDLQGHANTKVWGLSVSPLGDSIACCHSFHPSDMIEYGLPTDRQCSITISSLRKSGIFPAQHVSAGALYLSIRKWLENTEALEYKDIAPGMKDEILNEVVQTYGPPANLPSSKILRVGDSVSIELQKLITVFKRNTFLNRNTLKDRYDILVSHVCTPSDECEVQRTMIAFRMANDIQTLPDYLSKASAFSRRIASMSYEVVRFVCEESMEDDELPTDTEAHPPPETCDICTAPIPFENLHSALCENGHEFQRCGISFLSIQAPRITKFCGICSTPFFKDEFVFDQELRSMALSKDRDTSMPNEEAQRGTGPEKVQAAGTERADAEARGMEVQGQGSDKRLKGDEIERGQVESDIIEEEQQPQLSETDSSQDTDLPEQQPVKKGPPSNPARLGIRSSRNRRIREPPLTLARVLFLGCDVCPYCGAKYIG
ncbi:hypothetical protein CC78DRAFT_577076 [Lojkania enalia]|uniref:Transcription factor IIIC 90kDa subunit N-terminal domain-containing protein n=1 Tax=Lojkania enalia TaxID=147567 RepID=A0A9P4KFU2_9PLEO|nr:hypothetical protein CC78DRAFT_577076 [Didymosphaeria enalia]